QRARILETIDLPVLGEPERKLAIAPLAAPEDQMVMRAIHRFQRVALLDLRHLAAVRLAPFEDLHERIHVRRVVRQVPGPVIEVDLREMRRRDAVVARLELELLHELLELLANDESVREPERK